MPVYDTNPTPSCQHKSWSKSLSCPYKLRRRRTASRSIACRQHAESAVCLLVDADVVGEDGEEVEARFDPAERPLWRSEVFDVAQTS